MSEPGDLLIGKMGVMLVCTLLTFGLVVFPAAKKKRDLTISKARVVGLFCYAWVLSDVAYAVLYNPIRTGFGALPEGSNPFDLVAALLLSAIASQVVVFIFEKRRRPSTGG